MCPTAAVSLGIRRRESYCEPAGLSLSASVFGRWSVKDDATEARVITSIGWAEMPDFVRRALEYGGSSAR